MSWLPLHPTFVGVVHLLPLPGNPKASPGLEAVIARATADARTLQEGGADAVIVENLGDAPFTAGAVCPFTVAAMTRAVHAVHTAAPRLVLGVNVLRNDAHAALGIAAATGAGFIRVNIHTGAMVTDQGLIEGRARHTLLERKRLGAQVRIAADVMVKHAAPLGDLGLTPTARDTYLRGQADVLIVTGDGTGQPTSPKVVDQVRRAVPSAPVWVGSGLTPENAEGFRRLHGAIVGTYLHHDADLTAPLDVRRVRAIRAALGTSR